MLIWTFVFACGVESAPPKADLPEPVEQPEPAKVEPVESVEDLEAVLAFPLERGSCRDGRIRVQGQVVVDARDPEHVEWLVAQVRPEALPAAAVATGVLWDARAELPSSLAEPLADTLAALHRAKAADVEVLHCRKLKAVQGEGIAWNARGDALALLTRMPDRPAARAAFDRIAADLPELQAPGLAAFGDEDALHEVTKASLAQLCAGRTWETSWMLRTLDMGRTRGSLLPLGQHSTGGCELLAEGMDPDVVTPRQ